MLKDSDEAVFDEVWSQLSDENEEEANYYFDLLMQRMKRRRTRRLAFATGAIAACFFLSLFFLYPTSEKPLSTNLIGTQLENMGVDVSKEKVTLMINNQSKMNLIEAAEIKCTKDKKMELTDVRGSKIALENNKKLKLCVPAGQRFNMTLSDGTKVWLNADSWIEYTPSFEGSNERRVRFGGEAFFEVANDAKRPFIVEFNNGESVRVLGTGFNICSYDNQSITTLLSGRINYRNEAVQHSINLLPNEQVVVDKTTLEITKKEVNASEFIAWKNGLIYFNDEQLPLLMKRMERIYGIHIEVAPRLANLRFSGFINYDKGIDYITKLLTETSDIEFVIENGTINLH